MEGIRKIGGDLEVPGRGGFLSGAAARTGKSMKEKKKKLVETVGSVR